MVNKNGPGAPAPGTNAPPTVPPTAYKFDAVYGSDATSYEIYHTHIRDIVKSALDGVNGTVFAYGQTGSGKTYTIVGKKSAPGLLMLAADDMFEQITQRQANGMGEFSVRCAMIELYNEELNDLLVPPGQKLVAGVGSLKIKDDAVMGVKVVGLHDEVRGLGRDPFIRYAHACIPPLPPSPLSFSPILVQIHHASPRPFCHSDASAPPSTLPPSYKTDRL